MNNEGDTLRAESPSLPRLVDLSRKIEGDSARRVQRRRRQQETAEHRERPLAQRRQRRRQETEEQRNGRLEYQRHYDRFIPWKNHIY